MNPIDTKSSPWELAQLLANNSAELKSSLTEVFEDAIEATNEILSAKIDSSLKEAIWNAVSTKGQSILRETLTTVYYEDVMPDFDIRAINQFMDEYKQGKLIKSLITTFHLQFFVEQKQKSITRSLEERANLMAEDLIPDILTFLKNEHISFSCSNYGIQELTLKKS